MLRDRWNRYIWTWLVLLIFFPFRLPYFLPHGFELFRYVHWDCRRHRSDSRFGLAFLTDIPIFRIRHYCATAFPSGYGVIRSPFPISPRASMRICRYHQPAQYPCAYLTVTTGLARLTTVFRRAIKALRQFLCTKIMIVRE